MTGQIGPRGLGILLIAGLIGLALAIVGWSQRGNGRVAPSVGLGASAPARTAPAHPATMSGLTISVTRKAGGISVVAGVTGQQPPPARFYPGGGKVYVIESGLGDDSGRLDYNPGDDGLVVTNGQGNIVT
jgi:hypothetical protein